MVGIQALGSEGFTVKKQGTLSRAVGLAFQERCETGAVLDAQLAACKGILHPGAVLDVRTQECFNSSEEAAFKALPLRPPTQAVFRHHDK